MKKNVKETMKFRLQKIQKNSNLQFCFFFCFSIVIWIIGIADFNFSPWNQDDVNEKIKFLDFCKNFDVRVLAYTDVKMNSVSVAFELVDTKYKDCYEYYYIFLKDQEDKIMECKIWNKHKKEEKFSCTFENLTCGLYEVVIQPCYDSWECALLIIKYPELMNISNGDCVNGPVSIKRKSLYVHALNTEIVIGLAFASAIMIVTISGVIYYCRRSGRRLKHGRSDLEKGREKPEIIPKNIHVHILHYYDRNNVMKVRAENIKDKLQKSSEVSRGSFVSSVKFIEDELAHILFDVNNWLNNMLNKKDKNGNIRKIVLIDSEDFQDNECELENLMYSRFIEKLKNSLMCSDTDPNDRNHITFADYESLFVVRLDGINTYSEKLRDVVERVRYSFSDCDDDLKTLCLNLCSVSEMDISNA